MTPYGSRGTLQSAHILVFVFGLAIDDKITLNLIIHVANSVIILVSILCISINNILTLFIMTRPVHSGQVDFYLLINKLVPYQSFTCMDV